MHTVVKILINDDGDKETSPTWHLVVDGGGSEMAFCTGEVFGFGEGSAIAKIKTVKRGGITCEECLSKIKEIKSIRL